MAPFFLSVLHIPGDDDVWFTETPWPPVMICAAAAALLLIAWNRSARNWYLYGIGGLAIAAVAIVLFEWKFETEYETEIKQVEKKLYDLAEAVSQDDVDRVLAFLAKDNTSQRTDVKTGMSQFKIEDGLSITDVSSRRHEDGKRIIVHFRANGVAKQKPPGYFSQRIATRWEMTWDRTGDGSWKVVSIRRLEILSGDEMGILEYRE